MKKKILKKTKKRKKKTKNKNKNKKSMVQRKSQKKKTKDQANFTKKKKKKPETLIRDGGNFVQIFFLLFTLIFSLQFGEIVFWRVWRENLWTPLLFSLPSPLNQTMENVIFLLIFLSLFSILPVFTPTKYTLSVREWGWEGSVKCFTNFLSVKYFTVFAFSFSFNWKYFTFDQ